MKKLRLKKMSENIDKQDARSPIHGYELPTGWLDRETMEIHRNVELQEITGAEEDMLASNSVAPTDKMDNLIVSCTLKIGIHTDKQKIAEIVNDLTSNDRYFLIYKIREISLGKLYKFSAPCPFCKDDRLRIVDLSEVSVPALKDPAVRIYEGVLPRTQYKFKWRVQDGRREKDLNKNMKKNESNIFTIAILQRLIELDGQQPTIDMLKKLPIMDRTFLREQFTQVEGIIDDKIIVECPSCQKEFNVDADIGRKEFFFPSAS
jgi:hypothetical protein